MPRPSPLLLPAFALAYVGAVTAYLPLLSLLLPLKIDRIAGEARIGTFTVTVIAGALVASAANILFGWLSDRSVARGGGRRRWIAGGAITLLMAYAAIALATDAATTIAAVMLFQLAVNALLAPLMAIMADEIPERQRGLAGGLLALGTPVAAAMSALLVTVSALGEAARLAIVAAASTAALLPLLALPRAAIVPAEASAVPHRLPRRDLWLASAARLLVQVAGSALSLYLLYYFQSLAPGTATAALATQVGALLTLCYVLPLPVAVLVGRWSDRARHRKPFLAATALLAAAGLLAMALIPHPAAGAIGFAIHAIGAGAFLSLHSAYAIQLLPDPRHRGCDLGWLNLANTLPALLGPLLTWTLATPHDFTPLLIVLAAITALGGVAILGVSRPPSTT